MAKDPAVLFYTSDFMSGTELFNYDQKGRYIHILCTQHQLGHLPKEYISKIIEDDKSPVWSKFKEDNDGLWYNQRMHDEAVKRKNFTISRRNNVNSRYKKNSTSEATSVDTYVDRMKLHMEDKDDNIDISTDKNIEENSMDGNLEQHLLKWWGREGKMGYGVLCEFVDLTKKYDEESVFKAIEEAGKYNKRSIVYVKGILEKRGNKPKEVKVKRVGE